MTFQIALVEWQKNKRKIKMDEIVFFIICQHQEIVTFQKVMKKNIAKSFR